MTKRSDKIINQQIARTLYSGILLIAASCLLVSCGNSQQDIDAATGKGLNIQQDKATDVILYYSDNAKVRAVLHAKEFIRNETADPPYTDIKKNFKVEFMSDSLTVESTLTARSARIYEREGNVLVRDSVRIVNKKGEVLTTEELVWNQKLDHFYTEKKVTISSPSQIMYGDGLEANSDFSWYKIKNLKGVVAVEKKEIPE